MKFNISGFTHKGTGIYESNEDNMLINGFQLNDGELYMPNQEQCVCFVSDGVGGNIAGDFASSFIIEKIKQTSPEQYFDLISILCGANDELITASGINQELRGCACTLSGIIKTPEHFKIIHVGDTEIWLLRDEMFYKITQDEVLNPDDWRSPITNYFGSTKNNLKIKTDYIYPEPLPGDVYVICSDGLFKSLTAKIVKPILIEALSINEKIIKLKDACLSHGSDDNVTMIAVEVFE